MPEVTLKEALKKGKITLFWTPMLLFFLFLFGGLGLGLLLKAQTVLFMGGGFFLSFTLPWLWWSLKVVPWKIWAYSHVRDGKTLERRAISQQLIWPRGHFFEKTEIKSRQDRQTLATLYQQMDSTTIQKEIIEDHSLPDELLIDYPKANLYLYLALFLGCIYLLYVEEYFYGVLGMAGFAYAAFDLHKKRRHQGYLLKVNAAGVTLPTGSFPWSEITSYYVEKEGYGNSITFYLILEGEDFREKIDLSESNTNALQLEQHLDVYRSRYEIKQKLTRI